jgi:hypothetical protein
VVPQSTKTRCPQPAGHGAHLVLQEVYVEEAETYCEDGRGGLRHLQDVWKRLALIRDLDWVQCLNASMHAVVAVTDKR